MTRQTKTPRQRAEEALANAGRKVARLVVAVDKARVAHEQLQTELKQAQQRFDYVKQDPALNDGDSAPLPFEDEPAGVGG